MGRILIAILAFGAIMAIFQMVIVAIVIAGLIFRTKETLFVLLIGGLLTLFAAHPLIGVGLLVAIGIAAFIHNGRTYKEPAEPPAEPELPLFPATEEP